MVHKVLVIGSCYDGNNGATSNIVSNLIKLLSKTYHNVDVTMIGYVDSLKTVKTDKYAIRNPFSHITVHKVVRGILNKIRIDTGIFSWKFLFKKIVQKTKGIKFDSVIAASGDFYYMKAAYEYSRCFKTKLLLMYFDSYSKNITLKRESKKREKEEERWCEQASKIFYDAEGGCPDTNSFKEKVVPFLIPIFTLDKNIENKENYIMYGGNFFKGFREVGIIEAFMDKNPDLEFKVFSNAKRIKTINKNVTTCKMLDYSNYLKMCQKARAILVIGNGNNIETTPSKTIEALSFGKPIIFLNYKTIPLIDKKYPLFIDGNSNCLNEEIKKVEDKYNFPIYDLFPERNPKYLISKIYDSINEALFY